MNENLEHEKYEMAVAISVLSYDLNVANEKIATLLAENTLDMLVAKRDELLAKIDEQVSMAGFYEVPDHMDATWLAALLQTEMGAYVDAGVFGKGDVKAIILVDPGTV